MELGESRNFTFNLGGEIGVNNITDATFSGDNLTFGTATISGASVTVSVEPTATGVLTLKLVAELASNEVLVKKLRVHCVDSFCDGGSDRYGR